jgi:hypothetical protein
MYKIMRMRHKENPLGTSKPIEGIETKNLFLLFFKDLVPLWWKEKKGRFHSFSAFVVQLLD